MSNTIYCGPVVTNHSPFINLDYLYISNISETPSITSIAKYTDHQSLRKVQIVPNQYAGHISNRIELSRHPSDINFIL
jgi:hypothetical protein